MTTVVTARAIMAAAVAGAAIMIVTTAHWASVTECYLFDKVAISVEYDGDVAAEYYDGIAIGIDTCM